MLCVHLLGTNHVSEWPYHRLRNANRVHADIGKVHPHYLKAARRVAEWIRTQEYSSLCISGHSYGGAVAEIVAAIMTRQGEHLVMLRTYGAVKAGRLTVSAPAHHVFHYRHRGDIAPFWPPWPWYRRGGYTTVGKWRLPWKAHRVQSYRDATYTEIP
jgi:hypothetical protein